MIRALFVSLALMAGPAIASESIVAGLSQNRVSITADFDGSEIMIYGAVMRDKPLPEGPPLQVIITVEGPSTPLIVRKKTRRYGLWVNTDRVHIDSAPSFYAVTTTRPLPEVLSETENLRHQISIPRAIRAVGIADDAADSEDFITALLRVRQGDGRYSLQEGVVQFTEQTLFRSDVMLPANLTEGNYKVRMFITRDGRVVDTLERVIPVRKEGMERFLYAFAHSQPMLYGLAALLLAVLAGWGASAAFQAVRR